MAAKINVYFYDPQSPWQRGTNENTNGLLRQYFHRKTDLSGYSQADLNKVALQLNQRPRKTLGFETPASNSKPVLRRPVETASATGAQSLLHQSPWKGVQKAADVAVDEADASDTHGSAGCLGMCGDRDERGNHK